MEIPVLNRISDFQLPDPSFLSQALSISRVENVSETQSFSFWKWGALILAVLASFGTIITKINIFVGRLRQLRLLASKPLSQSLMDDDFSDISDDDDDDETCSISSSSSLSDDEIEPNSETSYDDDGSSTGRDEHFSVRGSAFSGEEREQNRNLSLLRRRSFGGHRFSWSDFTSGKSVVKLWDTSSPATFVSADTCDSGRVYLGVWDTRVGCRIPAMLAEWSPQLGRIVGVASGGGVEKVYMKDGVTGDLAVGDVRKMASPLENVTERGVDGTWWDTDAVIVTDESFDGSAVNGCDSAVTRCCSAVRSYLL